MSELEGREIKNKMEIYSTYDYLTTVPDGIVVIYRVMYTDAHNMERDIYIAVLDDGGAEVPWGTGVDATDALRAAEREYDYWHSQLSLKGHNPFHEILVRSKYYQ